jgi:hypothetical protein
MMMITGFGLIGAALRNPRQRFAVNFSGLDRPR